jgi:hypothetical protein
VTALQLLPKLGYVADAMTRQDMLAGLINDERTYVASLVARMRDLWRLAGGNVVASANVPHSSFEKANGMDAVIIVRIGRYFKCLGFEAKRPMFSANYAWDTLAGPAPGVSRFSRQLKSQSKLRLSGWITGAFIIDERPLGSGSPAVDSLGGAFLDQAYLIGQAEALLNTPIGGGLPRVWNTKILSSYLGGTSHQSLESTIALMLACCSGTPLYRDEVIASSNSFRDDWVPNTVGDDSDTDSVQDEAPVVPANEGKDLSLVRHVMKCTGSSSVVLFGSDERSGEMIANWRLKRLQSIKAQRGNRSRHRA